MAITKKQTTTKPTITQCTDHNEVSQPKSITFFIHGIQNGSQVTVITMEKKKAESK